MSVQAISWAMSLDIRPAGRKFTLIALANFANREGVCFPGQSSLAKDTSQSERSILTHLAELEKVGIIARMRRNREDGTRTSDRYQLNILPATISCSAERQPATISESTRNRCTPINRKGNRKIDSPSVVPPLPNSFDRTKGNGDGRAKRGTRLPTDWQPDEQDCEFARSLGLGPNDVLAVFRDYWFAKATNATKLDWHATWRNWCRREAEQRVKPGSQRQPPGGIAAAASRALARNQH